MNLALKISALSVVFLAAIVRAEDKCKGTLSLCLKSASMNVASGRIPASAKEVDDLCTAYNTKMACVAAWKKECLSLNARLQTDKEIASVVFFMGLLCNDTKFQKEYLNYTECFAGVSRDWDRCHLDYSSTVNDMGGSSSLWIPEKLIDACCARYGFNRCIAQASKAKCDVNAAVMLRRISETLSHREHCDKFDNSICSAPSHRITLMLLLGLVLSLLIRA